MLMPGVPDDEMLRTLAEQIRRLVGTLPVAIDDEALLPVTVSIGAVRAGDALRSVEGLVDCADCVRWPPPSAGAAIACSCSAISRSRISSPRSRSRSASHARSRSPRERARRPAARRRRARLRPGGRDRRAAAASDESIDEPLPARRTVTRYRHSCDRRPHPRARRARPRARDRLDYEEHAAAGERLVRSVAGRQRGRRDRRRARGVVRRHGLPGRPERRADPAREPHRRLRRGLREAGADRSAAKRLAEAPQAAGRQRARSPRSSPPRWR